MPSPERRARRDWRWCAGGGGVRAAFTRRGRVALVLSTAAGHRGRGLRRGTRLAPGLYRVAGSSTRLIGTRGGRVSFVAVASRSLSRDPAALRRYLRLAGVRR